MRDGVKALHNNDAQRSAPHKISALARQNAWAITGASTRKRDSRTTELSSDTTQSPKAPNTTLRAPKKAAKIAQKAPIIPPEHTPVNAVG